MIVEDGSIVADADALADLAFVDAYHAARNRTEWTAADVDAREASIVRASDHLCRHYGRRWLGSRVGATQALCWPRDGITGVDTVAIPIAVKQAAAELALEALRGDITAGSTQRVIKSATVGPISVDYADEAVTATGGTTIDAILADLITSNYGRSIVMERVW